MAGAGFHLLRDGLHRHRAASGSHAVEGSLFSRPKRPARKKNSTLRIPWRGHPYFKPVFFRSILSQKARFVLNCRKVVCQQNSLKTPKTALCEVFVACSGGLRTVSLKCQPAFAVPTWAPLPRRDKLLAQPKKQKPLRASNVLPPGLEPGTLRL